MSASRQTKKFTIRVGALINNLSIYLIVSALLLLPLQSIKGAANHSVNFATRPFNSEGTSANSAAATHKEKALTTLEKMPLYFTENRGQLDPRVAYYVQGKTTSVYFTSQGL